MKTCIALLLFFYIVAQAQTGATSLSEVVVSGKSEGLLRVRKEEINRVETLKSKDLQKKQAQTFAQIIDNERGIDTQTACAFCGAKRITINGLKGEHTTILVDGLPLHSTVSGFYGVEAIPLGGVDSIDIYRGAGASLTAPESIGGAINIVTKEVVTNSVESDISLSQDGQQIYSVVGTKRLNDQTGFLLGVQYGEILPLDLDNNRIAEQARQNTQSALFKVTHKLNEQDDLSLRLSYASLASIGGSMHRTKLHEAVSTTVVSDDFLNRDVRKKYLGTEKKITDNVNLERFEAAAIYRKTLNESSSLKLSLGAAWQKQDAIYSHGYDYDNKDNLWVGVLEYQKALNDQHLLTLGFDSKNQKMNSDSVALYKNRVPPLAQDDLTYQSLGGFVQDTWVVDEKTELSVVLRTDSIRTRWGDLNKKIDKSVLAPRLMFKRIHNEVLTSRLSAGLGYRSPLTLFESQHGMDHNGFILDINKLETAQSFVYSLAGQWQDDFFEFGAHLTHLENMAYAVDRADTAEPTIFKNANSAYNLSVLDLSYGRRITHDWTLEGLVENFNYPTGYKEKLPVAAIEKRLSLTSNVLWDKWTASQKLIVIFERNLSSYDYGDHYNVAPSEDPLDPSFGGPGVDQKRQKAPTYFTVDLSFERSLAEGFYLGFAALNVFDYTQTKAGDSPTAWHQHGSHFHLDNLHIWGPLRGRQLFVSLRGVF